MANATARPAKTRTLLLSVSGAIIIWLFNELNKDGYTLNVRYPVKLTYNDSLYIPVSPLPRSVTAILSGTGWSLVRKSLSFTVAPVVYELPNPLQNNTLNMASLAASMTEQVKDVKINSVVADTIGLSFDRFMTKTSLLRLDSSGIGLAKRFVISSFVNVSPEKVTFKGPALLVDALPDTIVVRVPTKNIQDNYDEYLPIRYPKSVLVKASAERVFVSFEVAELFRPLPPANENKKEEDKPKGKKNKPAKR